jgi:hypothetical protein
MVLGMISYQDMTCRFLYVSNTLIVRYDDEGSGTRHWHCIVVLTFEAQYPNEVIPRISMQVKYVYHLE